MPASPKRPPRPANNGSNHPIAWFSALLRGVDRNDKSLIDEAQDRLEQLGFFVVPMPPPRPTRQGGGQ
jgi:hypothetical protein